MNKLVASIFLATMAAGSGTARAAICLPTLDAKKTLSWSSGTRIAAGTKWSAGVSAGVGLFADCTRLSAEMSTAVNNTTLDSIPVDKPPLELKISASTKRNQTSSIDVSVFALGYQIKKLTLADSTTPISGGFSGGYVLPDGDLDGQWTYAPSWAGGAVATLRYNTVADIAASAYYRAGPTAVSILSLAAANMTASVNASLTYRHVSLSGHGLLNIARLTQGGHAALKQDVGSNWKADASNVVFFDDVLGVNVQVDVPFLGKRSLFSMRPKHYHADYTYQHDFVKPF